MPETMTRDQILAFLDASAPTAHLATVRADGRPHVVAIWFVRDGDDIVFVTSSASVKAKNLARTGYAALSVDDPQPPFAFVALEGPVAVDDDLEQVRHWGEIGAARYMGSEWARAYMAPDVFPDDLVCRLTPSHMTGMSNLAG